MCKCLRSNLEKLVEERPEFKGKNKLTKFNCIRILSAVRCAIKLADPNDPQRIKKLRHNIKNSVYHVFGVHKNCSSTNTDIEKEEDDKHDTGDFVGAVMDEQAACWTEGASEDALGESGLGSSFKYEKLILEKIIHEVSLILNRLAEKAERLIAVQQAIWQNAGCP